MKIQMVRSFLPLLLIAAFVSMTSACGSDEIQPEENPAETPAPPREGPATLKSFEGIEVSGKVTPLGSGGFSLFYRVQNELNKSQAKDSAGVDMLPQPYLGFDELADGEGDMLLQDGPISAKDFATLKSKGVAVLEIPLYVNALGFAVNNDNDWCKALTIDQVRSLFGADGVDTWKGLDASWPSEKVVPITFSSREASFRNFEAALFGKSGKKFKSKMLVSGYNSKRIGTLTRTKGGVGTVKADAVLYETKKVRALPLALADGESVAFTGENIRSGKYSFQRTTTFLYINAKSYERDVVKAFVHHLLRNLQNILQGEGYVMPPDSVLNLAVENLKNARSGTHFIDSEGKARSGTLEENFKPSHLLAFK